MILNKNNKGYKFDKLVKSFYQDIVKSFEQERTNHIFKPFGCDFAFIDADKPNYLNYYEACITLVRPGGLIAIDNVLWSGRVANPGEQDEKTIAIRELNDHIADDARITQSMLPLGDGLTLAYKNP